jgi:hypothetical protein
MLAGAAAMLGVILLWHAWHQAMHPRRSVLIAGGVAAVAAVAFVGGLCLAAALHQSAANAAAETIASSALPQTPTADEMPPPAATSSTPAMPPASVMSQILAMPSTTRPRSAEPMDQAAAKLAARLERQGGTAADWSLLAQAYDFLGRPDDARRARARAAQAGSGGR